MDITQRGTAENNRPSDGTESQVNSWTPNNTINNTNTVCIRAHWGLHYGTI
ncbi:hypothetical protein IRJ41_003420 [Triplophysa rosa]|uniref:Uncharacterized protein n=1 Tax=Triplophysa rosa TaxID=992332 RepID=A0A9W7WTU8_TRIRA|nr:hypothetical protein IRJ41_003420 [Triplophysa rosa]